MRKETAEMMTLLRAIRALLIAYIWKIAAMLRDSALRANLPIRSVPRYCSRRGPGTMNRSAPSVIASEVCGTIYVQMTKDTYGQIQFSSRFDVSLNDFDRAEIQLMQNMLAQFYSRLEPAPDSHENDQAD